MHIKPGMLLIDALGPTAMELALVPLAWLLLVDLAPIICR